MYICPNSLVYNKPEEFGVDSENAKDAIKWQSIDGSNTYEIRLERLKRLESVVGSKIIITDK
jgi:hypothetical protein